MTFSWDPKKAKSNVHKHHVSFTEAMTVFEDPYAESRTDVDHSERAILIGYSMEQRLLIVVHIEYIEDDWIRIVSARKATRSERRRHEKWKRALKREK